METTIERLAYLRAEIEAERISYGEIAELQSLCHEIDPGDVVLLEWAGVEEGDDDQHAWYPVDTDSEQINYCHGCMATKDSDGGIIR